MSIENDVLVLSSSVAKVVSYNITHSAVTFIIGNSLNITRTMTSLFNNGCIVQLIA